MIGILWLFLQSAASHLLYLALRLETGSFPKPLSAKEEQAAFAAMRAGDAAARETLICHNLRLVAHIVKKYYTVSGGQDDFISIGTIGLIKAVDTYDCTRTTRFASYASRCIENELRMQLRHTRREAGTVSLQEPLETGADSGMLTLADVLPDLAHCCIPGSLFTVSQAEIYPFRLYLFCFHIFQPSWKPDRRRHSGCCRKFDSAAFLVSAPQGKQSRKGISSQDHRNIFYIFF